MVFRFRIFSHFSAILFYILFLSSTFPFIVSNPRALLFGDICVFILCLVSHHFFLFVVFGFCCSSSHSVDECCVTHQSWVFHQSANQTAHRNDSCPITIIDDSYTSQQRVQCSHFAKAKPKNAIFSTNRKRCVRCLETSCISSPSNGSKNWPHRLNVMRAYTYEACARHRLRSNCKKWNKWKKQNWEKNTSTPQALSIEIRCRQNWSEFDWRPLVQFDVT